MEPSSRSCRILIVDDDHDTAQAFAALIEAMQHQAAFSTDPVKAVEMAKVFRPTLAFLDLNMPKLDGYALARTLRAQPGLDSLRLVAVSGHDAPEDRARSREAGFDAHVAKPLDKPLLEAILKQMATNW